ncbi:type II secretion system protein [Puniceicoccus vermicola]|uniref:Type II secretion system protein n=1 Tax=Puniceicoccus vermicola TaxID=388746 RepID=A0A7X1E3Z1_9BACT|nr:type II secretion system protein [Puniceicoccus vermicola]MBC2601581.1 type II secretion system protein [Puniceicoccus vermicola]
MNSLSKRSGFSLIELIATVAVIFVLIGLGYAGISRARVNAQKSQSVSNLKEIGQAIMLYAADHSGKFPLMCSSDAWQSPIWSTNTLPEYLDENRFELEGGRRIHPVFVDPMLAYDRHGTLGDYGANAEVLRGYPSYPGEGALRISSLGNTNTAKLMMVLAAENGGAENEHGMWYINSKKLGGDVFGISRARPSTRGTDTVLGVFADGHVEAVPEDEFAENFRDYLLVEAE